MPFKCWYFCDQRQGAHSSKCMAQVENGLDYVEYIISGRVADGFIHSQLKPCAASFHDQTLQWKTMIRIY
uniref:Uncharacterized protein n=1 Tax=Anguilla anguilla TaxID=7936 RepID=A0A0E9S4I1_ANGAN